MADYELIGLNEATPDLRAPTSADVGVLVGGLRVNGSTNLAGGANIAGDTVATVSRTNPLARAIAVQMTASTTVGGVQQLSAADLNMGTNDFTLEFDEVIPTTRPAAAIVLDRKHDGTNGYILSLLTTGVVRLQINATNYDSTVALASATNVNPKLYISVIRETASAAGSVTFYSGGPILGAAVTITAGAPTSVNNTSARVVNGTTTTRTAGSLQASRMYNRALDAPTVLDYTINGPALSQRGATQSVTVTNPEFTPDGTGWVSAGGGSVNAFVSGGEITVSTTTTQNIFTNVGSIRAGGMVRVRCVFRGAAANIQPSFRLATDNFGTNELILNTLSTSTYGTTTIADFTAINTGTISRNLLWVREQNGIGGQLIIDSIQIWSAGIVSELIASNAQSNTGQIIDSSGNRNHALLPASGATIVGANPARSRQVRSRHQWTATNELQYLTGVNQEVLPPSAAIEFIDIFSDASVSVNIGNGTTATQYASAASLVAGWNRVTLASAYSGTTTATRKLTITPTASATAILNVIVTYHASEVEM
jgi:hypothetical protein